ncbi:MAG: restriction endonuclease subunit S [Nitrosospira sp.]|nr:restriction endonuclease subunit S [Nitrosospira sp.]
MQTGRAVRNGVRCLRVVDMVGSRIDPEQLITTSDEISQAYKRTLLRENDLVIALRGKIGAVAVIGKELSGANLTRGVALLSASENFHSGYLLQYLSSSSGRNAIEKNLNGSALQEIPIAALRKIFAAAPLLPEQRAIAGALSDVDTLIGALDRLIAKKCNLKQATMQQLLTGQTRLPGFSETWEAKRLGEIGTTYGGLTGKTKADFGSGSSQYIPFLNVIGNTVVDPNNLEQVRISASEAQNQARKDDLFFNGSSETPEEVGMCAVLLADFHKVYLNSFCFGFRVQEGVEANGLFLAYFFRSGTGRKLLYFLAQGATRYNLSKTNFLKLEIPLPRPDEQTAIAAILSDMNTEIAALEARRDKTRALKQGMMQELLTGRIRLI